MTFINYASREINCKIVYYGPGLCGKTTNLQYIYDTTAPTAKGKLISLATETDRGLFVTALLAAGYGVIAVNPLSTARYRERLSTSGAKSDPGDARVLAELARVEQAMSLERGIDRARIGGAVGEVAVVVVGRERLRIHRRNVDRAPDRFVPDPVGLDRAYPRPDGAGGAAVRPWHR